MYIINLFGTGIRYWVCKIPVALFDEMEAYKKNAKCAWEEIFFDLHVLAKWGFESWENIHLMHNGRGWLIGGENYIEFRTKGKRVKKMIAQELNNAYVLFNPFALERNEEILSPNEEFKVVILVQIETGLVFKSKINQEKIDLDKMIFHLNYGPLKENFEEDWVTKISYEGRPVLCSDEDTLVRSSKVILI